MLKVTDLFNSRDFVDLDESEMEKITGGNLSGACSPRGYRYLEADGDLYECQDSPLWFPDKWVHIN